MARRRPERLDDHERSGTAPELGFAEYTADGDRAGMVRDGYRQDPAIASDAANRLLGRSRRKPSDAPWFMAVNFVNRTT